jgi:hypothetical protein
MLPDVVFGPRGLHETKHPMAKPPKDYSWRIYHTKDTPAKLIGSITAPDEESALRTAIVELKIEDKLRSRLVALRQG